MSRKERIKKWVKKHLEHIHWNSITILISLVTAMIITTSVILAFSVLEYYFNDAAVQISVQSNEQSVKNVQKSIDSYMDEMLMIAEKTEELFRKHIGSDEIEQIEFVIREDIDTIAVFRRDGKLLMKSDDRPIKEQVDVSTETWFQKALAADGEVIFTALHVQRLYKGAYPWVISMARKIYCQGQEGIVLVDMNFANIKKLCTSKDISDAEIYILDEEGNVMYHPNQQMLYAGIQDSSIAYAMELKNETKAVTFDGMRHIISSCLMDSNGWKIVIVNDMKWLELLIEKIKYSAVKLMQTAQDGDFSVRASGKGYYEVEELTSSFNSMVNQISKLLADIKREHELLRKSEMKTLHEQINSHFLYNTLDSVIWMAEVDDKENSIKMLKALSKFFRLSLSSGKEKIWWTNTIWMRSLALNRFVR